MSENELKLEVDPVMVKKIQELAKMFPKEAYRSEGRAASIVARQILSSVKKLGGKQTGRLEPLSDLRVALRGSENPGGILSKNGKALCRVQRRSNGIYAGYISGVEKVLARWQDGGVSDNTTNARHMLHKVLGAKGFGDMEVPLQSVQNERSVVKPIAALANKDFPKWVMSNMTKMIEKKLSKFG